MREQEDEIYSILLKEIKPKHNFWSKIKNLDCNFEPFTNLTKFYKIYMHGHFTKGRPRVDRCKQNKLMKR